jgi:hypothetical protein
MNADGNNADAHVIGDTSTCKCSCGETAQPTRRAGSLPCPHLIAVMTRPLPRKTKTQDRRPTYTRQTQIPKVEASALDVRIEPAQEKSK